MSPYQNLNLSLTGTTWIVTLNRPSALNALNTSVLKELDLLLEDVAQRSFEECRAIILIGHGDKAFCAGADIKELQELSPEQAYSFSELGKRVFTKLSELKVPVIAAINGVALGGGLELALACDFMIASEKAQFSLPETHLGLIPGFGGVARLVDRIGMAKCKYMVLGAQKISASEAQQMGLVEKVVSIHELLAEAERLATHFSQLGPVALQKCKQLAQSAFSQTYGSVFRQESREFSRIFETRDSQEGIKAFIEKRKPEYRGI